MGLTDKFPPSWATAQKGRKTGPILGDLTVIYDMAGPWITPQLAGLTTNVVVINNGGGAIFKRMFAHPAFLNAHSLSFEPLAEFLELAV